MKRDASWIASAVGGRLRGAEASVTGSTQTDSRLCDPGSLYIARVGESADGHDFVEAAAQRGAVCAIVERPVPVDLPQIVVPDATVALGLLAKAHLADLRTHHAEAGQAAPVPFVVGITGSAGKTTTKDLLGQLLSAQGPTVYPRLSFNNEVGCPLTILRADYSTRFLVLEMGASGPGHLRYLTEIAPLDLAVVLMVGVAHLGGFGSPQALTLAKQELVEGLLPSGQCILNYDDAQVRGMAAASPTAPLYFSAEGAPEAQIRAEGVQLDAEGRPHFALVQDGQRADFSVPLVGAHQVVNALAAAAAARVASGASFVDLASDMRAAARLSPHRLAVHRDVTWRGVAGLQVIDDSYNANPDSMVAGLAAARRLAGDGRLVAVLGEMLELGDESPRLHAELGASVRAASVSVLIGVGAGTAPLLATAVAGLPGQPGVSEAHDVADSAAALLALPGLVRSGDTIFLKGSLGSGVWRVADALLSDSCDDSTQSK